MPHAAIRAASLSAVAAALVLTGCAGPAGPTSFTIDQGEYAAAFSAARDELRSRRFDLQRVDARAGIMTTEAASSVGLLTPWIDHTDTLVGAMHDVLNEQRRVAVVRFVTDEAAPTLSESPADAAGDIRAAPSPLRVEVIVVVERIYRPGRRVDPTDVRLRSITSDPAWKRQGLQPWHTAAEEPDERLAARVAQGIRDRLARGAAETGS